MLIGAPAQKLLDEIIEKMKDEGYLLGKTGVDRNVLTFMPPLVVDQTALDGMVETLDAVLRQLA